MEYRGSADISGANVINAGGGGGGGFGGGKVIGGGLGVILLILATVFGFDPAGIMGGGADDTSQTSSGTQQVCHNASDIQANRDCRWNAYVSSIETYWSGQVQNYSKAPLVLFTNSIATGCGQASADVGPFYCPADKKVYLDEAFTQQLLQQLGAKGGDAAEAYIIAHEYGHHIQDLLGIMNQVNQGQQQTGPTSPQVRLELQADCFAGVWFRHSTDDPNGPIQSITQDDLNRVVDAAVSVGDDRIQQSQAGRVNPESWTHGSSAMRKYWMSRGFKSGDPRQCDTFSATNLGG